MVEDLTLKIIYENSIWPIVTFHPEEEEFSIDAPLIDNGGYIIFINHKTEDLTEIWKSLKGNNLKITAQNSKL